MFSAGLCLVSGIHDHGGGSHSHGTWSGNGFGSNHDACGELVNSG